MTSFVLAEITWKDGTKAYLTAEEYCKLPLKALYETHVRLVSPSTIQPYESKRPDRLKKYLPTEH